LQYIKPDYIQVYTKGLPGLATYPTKIGIASPGLVKDPIKIFRSETAKYGIALYGYYSPLLDDEAVKNHPEWGRLNAGGSQDVQSSAAISVYSPYVDSYFIPQLKELSANYNLDGFWMDGDCWAMEPDYSPAAIAAYTKAMGKTNIPRSAADPDYHDYIVFTRQSYCKFLAHYVNVMHRFNPKLQICSDWAYAYMPGPVDTHVDFLSGDQNSDDPAEIEWDVRLLEGDGLPWDLMGWGYGRNTALPLEKKAAIALAQGGGFEVYIMQNRDASLPTDNLAPTKETGEFCRARKEYCFKTKAIPQVAILFSSYGHDLESNSVFSISDGGLDKVKAMLTLYLSMQYSTQVLQEHQFAKNLNEYPLIIIPGWDAIEPSFVSRLKQYVNNGGKLLIMGAGANDLFKDVEIQYINKPYGNPAGFSIKAFTYGKGLILGILNDMSVNDLAAKMGQVKLTMGVITSRLFQKPIITVNGSDQIHVNATTKNGEKLFHLVNINPSANATAPLNVTLRLDTKPSAILLQPDNQSLPFTYADGAAKLTVPGVPIYSILEVKN
jgi:hypothetical protein